MFTYAFGNVLLLVCSTSVVTPAVLNFSKNIKKCFHGISHH